METSDNDIHEQSMRETRERPVRTVLHTIMTRDASGMDRSSTNNQARLHMINGAG